MTELATFGIQVEPYAFVFANQFDMGGRKVFPFEYPTISIPNGFEFVANHIRVELGMVGNITKLEQNPQLQVEIESSAHALRRFNIPCNAALMTSIKDKFTGALNYPNTHKEQYGQVVAWQELPTPMHTTESITVSGILTKTVSHSVALADLTIVLLGNLVPVALRGGM